MAEDIAARLIALAAEDKRVRAELAASGELFRGGYHPVMQAVHEANADGLAEIVSQIGWPTSAKVGEEAAGAAWMIAQHAIGRPNDFRAWAALVEAAVGAGEAPAWQVAFMTDRIRTFEGRGQLYGSQFNWDEAGEMSPLPIEDPEGVEAWRAAAGMEPLSERIAQVRAEAKQAGDRRPDDWAQQRAAFARWAEKTGWR